MSALLIAAGTKGLIVPAVKRLMRVGVMITAACVVTVGPTALAATAKPDERPCVVKAEYKQIKKGMTMARVHGIFDTRGTILFQNPGAVTNGAREYRSCSNSRLGATVQIQYNNYATNGGPFRVVNIDFY